MSRARVSLAALQGTTVCVCVCVVVPAARVCERGPSQRLPAAWRDADAALRGRRCPPRGAGAAGAAAAPEPRLPRRRPDAHAAPEHEAGTCTRPLTLTGSDVTEGPGPAQVFEDDHVLSRASDSGCPSESLLEEDEGPDPSWPPQAPLAPDDPVLEWDPSVDVGHSVCQDAAAAAASCFTSSTGERLDPGEKRRSYLGAHDPEAELVSWLLRTSCCSSPCSTRVVVPSSCRGWTVGLATPTPVSRRWRPGGRPRPRPKERRSLTLTASVWGCGWGSGAPPPPMGRLPVPEWCRQR